MQSVPVVTGAEMAQGPSTSQIGFTGSIGSLPLADLLQVWSLNRYSGLVRVALEEQSGRLYFVDGEIVHAEAENLVGEPALQAIIGWPGGAFELFPNTATLHRTIQKRFSHLLLDAHRALDERRRQGPLPAPATVRPQGGAGAQGAAGVLERIRAIPGVTRVVRFSRDGRTSGRDGPDGEQLAAKGLYLAVNHAAAVASALGLGELSIAAVQGERESFAVVHRAGVFLCVAIEPGTPTERVTAQLRALLTRPVS